MLARQEKARRNSKEGENATQAVAQLRHYTGTTRLLLTVLRAGLYIMAGSYLQTRLLVHDYERMVV